MSIIKLNNQSISAVTSLPAAISTGKILNAFEYSTSSDGSSVSGGPHNIMETSYTPVSSNSKLIIYAFIVGKGGRNCCSYRQSPFAVRVSTSASQTNGTDVCFGSFGHQMSGDSTTRYNFVCTTLSGSYTNSNTTTKYISVNYLGGGSSYNFVFNETTDTASYSGNKSGIIILEKDAS